MNEAPAGFLREKASPVGNKELLLTEASEY
jgi:hypothetical protein